VNHLNRNIRKLVDEETNGKTSVFAKMIGVSGTTIYDIYHGNTKAGGSVILKIAKTFPSVDLNWLIKGMSLEKSINKAEDIPLKYRKRTDLYDFNILIKTVEELREKVEQLEKILSEMEEGRS